MNSNIATGYPLYISNKYRNTLNEQPFDFYIPDVSGAVGIDRHFMISLVSCTLTNNFNTVSENRNDIFKFRVNGTTYTNQIQSGYYDAYTFVDEINAALAVPGIPGLSVTYDDIQRTLVWTIPAAVTNFMLIRELVSYRSGIPVDSYLYPARDDRFLELCGCLLEGNRVFVGPTTFVGSSPINLYGTRLIHINLGTELGILTPTYTRAQTIASIPITVNRGEVEYWQASNLIGHPISGDQLQNLRIYAHDEWEHLVDDVPPNTLCHLTFLLTPST